MNAPASPRLLGSIVAATLFVAASAPRAQSSDAHGVEDLVRQLPSIASSAPQFEALAARVRARTQGLAGVTITVNSGSSPSLQIDFARPIAVARVAQLLGIGRPYAISGDVTQQQWELVSWAGRVADPYNARIATEFPTAGRWILRALLVARPAGALPREVAGASPAYDLHRYSGDVRAIEIALAP